MKSLNTYIQENLKFKINRETASATSSKFEKIIITTNKFNKNGHN